MELWNPRLDPPDPLTGYATFLDGSARAVAGCLRFSNGSAEFRHAFGSSFHGPAECRLRSPGSMAGTAGSTHRSRRSSNGPIRSGRASPGSMHGFGRSHARTREIRRLICWIQRWTYRVQAGKRRVRQCTAQFPLTNPARPRQDLPDSVTDLRVPATDLPGSSTHRRYPRMDLLDPAAASVASIAAFEGPVRQPLLRRDFPTPEHVR